MKTVGYLALSAVGIGLANTGPFDWSSGLALFSAGMCFQSAIDVLKG